MCTCMKSVRITLHMGLHEHNTIECIKMHLHVHINQFSICRKLAFQALHSIQCVAGAGGGALRDWLIEELFFKLSPADWLDIGLFKGGSFPEGGGGGGSLRPADDNGRLCTGFTTEW